MLDKAALVEILQLPDLSKVDKLLCCLAVEAREPKSVSEVRRNAFEAGWREVKNLNVSEYLRRARPFAVRTREGWRLTKKGQERVLEILSLHDVGGVPLPKHFAASLRDQLINISDATTKGFVEEAVKCYECDLFRASVVLSWAGAVAVLYDYLLADAGRLKAFNAEARRRNAKWKDAKTKDDLARMRESDFLDILETISIIGKNTKQRLKDCLQLRNASAHPNTLHIGPQQVAAHLETLILNVFSKFT